ncbi:MAG: DNA-processing protein DprA [Candidatus Paceibacterota bacterium]
MDENWKFLNAISKVAMAKIGALQKIYDTFAGDWQRAWNSDLSGFLPRRRNAEGKLEAVDFKKIRDSIDSDLEWGRLKKEKIDMITVYDNNYPTLLRHISDPPFLIYTRGSKDVWNEDCFAVVGTRAMSEYGERSASRLTADLAKSGFVIVSGLALGIDTVAHRSALAARVKTIAVLGCGIDDQTIYPRQNQALAREIIQSGGTVMSEYAPGVYGSRFTGPQRNRIITGLSKGVLVVEADIKSGAMITAKCAVDQNRDVFAIPGDIFARTSFGTNNIIKKGAKLVSSIEDILEEY